MAPFLLAAARGKTRVLRGTTVDCGRLRPDCKRFPRRWEAASAGQTREARSLPLRTDRMATYALCRKSFPRSCRERRSPVALCKIKASQNARSRPDPSAPAHKKRWVEEETRTPLLRAAALVRKRPPHLISNMVTRHSVPRSQIPMSCHQRIIRRGGLPRRVVQIRRFPGRRLGNNLPGSSSLTFSRMGEGSR
jgi:hypothetical protein